MIHDEDDDDEDDDEDDDDCEMMHERLILYLLHTSLATNTKNQPSQAPKTGEHQRIDCQTDNDGKVNDSDGYGEGVDDRMMQYLYDKEDNNVDDDDDNSAGIHKQVLCSRIQTQKY